MTEFLEMGVKVKENFQSLPELSCHLNWAIFKKSQNFKKSKLDFQQTSFEMCTGLELLTQANGDGWE